MDPRDNLSAICLDFLLSLAFDAVKINRGRGYMMGWSSVCSAVWWGSKSILTAVMKQDTNFSESQLSADYSFMFLVFCQPQPGYRNYEQNLILYASSVAKALGIVHY